MKTRIILAFFISQIVCLFFPQTAFCQTETFDMITYTAPKGWTKTVKKETVSFSDLNKNANVFCAITVYVGTASSGDPKKDFAVDWKAYVAKPYKADENPKTQPLTADGWTITTATAVIEIDGTKSLALLTVFSGYNKTSSVLVFSNSETYTKPVSDFLESVQLDKTPLAIPSPFAQVSPTTPVANSNSPAALVGRWGNGIASDSVSGNIVTYGSNATQQYYKFNADGTYSYVFSGYSGLAGTGGSFRMTTQESGVYAINGDAITITPKKSQTNSSSEGLHNNPLETVTYRWTIHYFEGVKEYSLVLHPDKQTKRDGGFSYGCLAFPNSYCYSQIK